jgi:hypothetical protein
MTAPGLEATPLSCAATSFLLNMIFSRFAAKGSSANAITGEVSR